MTPIINFANILRAAFSKIFFYQNCNKRKAWSKHFCMKKLLRKILIKLTPSSMVAPISKFSFAIKISFLTSIPFTLTFRTRLRSRSHLLRQLLEKLDRFKYGKVKIWSDICDITITLEKLGNTFKMASLNFFGCNAI